MTADDDLMDLTEKLDLGDNWDELKHLTSNPPRRTVIKENGEERDVASTHIPGDRGKKYRKLANHES